MDQVIKTYVLDAVANDYENLETIIADTTSWAKRDGILLKPDRLIQTLAVLIDEGMVKAYSLSETERNPKEVPFDLGLVDLLWFYITPLGRTALPCS